jgi:hypothetical protein
VLSQATVTVDTRQTVLSAQRAVDHTTRLAASVGFSTRRPMSRAMKFLQLNLQKQRNVQHSVMNDETLKGYAALVISEPYVVEMNGKVTISPMGHQGRTLFYGLVLLGLARLEGCPPSKTAVCPQMVSCIRRDLAPCAKLTIEELLSMILPLFFMWQSLAGVTSQLFAFLQRPVLALPRFRLKVSARLKCVGAGVNSDAEDAWDSSESGVGIGNRNTSSSAASS